MKEKVNIINEELISDLENVKSLKDVADLKVKYFGKKGLVTELTSNMKDLSVEEKKELGKLANEVRTNVAEKISEVEKRI